MPYKVHDDIMAIGHDKYKAEHVVEIDHLKYMLKSIQKFVQLRYFH
jgi:hypothetical protein